MLLCDIYVCMSHPLLGVCLTFADIVPHSCGTRSTRSTCRICVIISSISSSVLSPWRLVADLSKHSLCTHTTFRLFFKRSMKCLHELKRNCIVSFLPCESWIFNAFLSTLSLCQRLLTVLSLSKPFGCSLVCYSLPLLHSGDVHSASFCDGLPDFSRT